ncbi:MAG: hypothetical protein A2Z04_04000 [Chloroflexi bacterium RBG_16_57_9]|nr:MAG: hypothetical protein A2Z04_04000 [Chloroflexi bacterium RBG_16_57_9]
MIWTFAQAKPVRRPLILLIAMLVLSAFVMPQGVTSQHPVNTGQLQPSLLQIAAQTPEKTVPVIIMQKYADPSLAETVRHLGGHITHELSIIQALAAEVPAGALSRLAEHPAVRWISSDSPMVKQSESPYQFTSWATHPGQAGVNQFTNPGAIYDSQLGPNGAFGSGAFIDGQRQATFSGFVAEGPEYRVIRKVEAILDFYVTEPVVGGEVTLVGNLNGQSGVSQQVPNELLNQHVGLTNAGRIYIDLTRTRKWTWSDFGQSLELVVSHEGSSPAQVYYDAIGLRITAVDEPGAAYGSSGGLPIIRPRPINPTNLVSAYNRAIGATAAWALLPLRLRTNVTVAIVDSGVMHTPDLGRRLIATVNFNTQPHTALDGYGHGTHIAGIIAGDGSDSGGRYIGVAPNANIVSVRVAGDDGSGRESDLVAGLQWVLKNKDAYNIRVVNLSMNSNEAKDHNYSPLDAALEILWFNKIVVVVSAGNNGRTNDGILFPPANDPFVITAGATEDQGTPDIQDDVIAPFSAYTTVFTDTARPDLMAPGHNLVTLLPENERLGMTRDHLDHQVPGVNPGQPAYFRLSGTSSAAAVVSGAAALLLDAEPSLNPDQVKYRLMHTASKADLWPAYDARKAGAGYLNLYRALQNHTLESANTGLPVSQLLLTGPNPMLINPPNWGNVDWGSVDWGSVDWGSVDWGSVDWGSVYWGD